MENNNSTDIKSAVRNATNIRNGKTNELCNNFITNGNNPQAFIFSILSSGRENAMPITDIMKKTGLSNKRHIQHLIAQEREMGFLILSDCTGCGYFLPAQGEQGREEIKKFLHRYKAQSINTLKTLKSFENALRVNPEQFTITELEQ